MEKNCTLLVNSYDGGEDLWEGFFTTLKAEWPDCKLPIVLNTESKTYSFPGLDIQTFSLYPAGKEVPWGKRMLDTLKRIDTKYILFFLEDFWLDAPVDTTFLEQCFRWMEENPDVATMSFKETYTENIRDGRFERFEKRPLRAEYRFNCQAALWRTERLIAALRPHESPWEWEVEATPARSHRMKDGFYTLIEGEKQVFSYDLGGVIYRGKWCERVVIPIQKKYGLVIDFSHRGFFDEEKWQDEFSQNTRKETLWQRIKKPDLVGRVFRRLKRELKKVKSAF